MHIRRLVLLAPVVFVLHVVEEAPRFVSYFNSLVPRGITQETFMSVNAGALVITVLLTLFVTASPDTVSGLLLAGWVGFLFLANALFHLVATSVHGRYCPGVVTGTILYLPFGVLLLHAVARDLELRPALVWTVALVGGLPMVFHGFLIVFRSSRLF